MCGQDDNRVGLQFEYKLYQNNILFRCRGVEFLKMQLTSTDLKIHGRMLQCKSDYPGSPSVAL